MSDRRHGSCEHGGRKRVPQIKDMTQNRSHVLTSKLPHNCLNVENNVRKLAHESPQRYQLQSDRVGNECRENTSATFCFRRVLKRQATPSFPQATVFRQSRDLNGCMVMVSMSKKGQRGLDMHVRAYVPATQETFR